MNIAFIGLGNMGSAMATNLIKAGHALIARARADELKLLGARSTLLVFCCRSALLRGGLRRKEGKFVHVFSRP